MIISPLQEEDQTHSQSNDLLWRSAAGSRSWFPKCKVGLCIQGCIQKFPNWLYNRIYAYLWYYLLRSNTKGYGSKNSLDWLTKYRYNCT